MKPTKAKSPQLKKPKVSNSTGLKPPPLPKNWGKVNVDGKPVDFSSFQKLLFSSGYVPLHKYDEALHLLRIFKIVIGKIKNAPPPYNEIAKAIEKLLKERGE